MPGPNLPNSPLQQLLPVEAYTSTEWFERERRLIFGNEWTYAGVVTDLPNAGDYLTLRVGVHPLFVVRDDAGGLHAYHNICRHRGATLLEEQAGNVGSPRRSEFCRWTTYRFSKTLRHLLWT